MLSTGLTPLIPYILTAHYAAILAGPNAMDRFLIFCRIPRHVRCLFYIILGTLCIGLFVAVLGGNAVNLFSFTGLRTDRGPAQS